MTNTTAATNNQDLVLAARAILGNNIAEIPLRDGKQLQVRPAKMNQLKLIVNTFTRIAESMDGEALGGLIESVQDLQDQAMKEGADPLTVDIAPLDKVKMARGALKDVSILKQLFLAVLDELPMLASSFTNLTEEEFGNLDYDEGVLVIGSVFVLNYGFFTQSWPLLLTAFGRSLSDQQQKSPTASAANKQSGTPRRVVRAPASRR